MGATLNIWLARPSRFRLLQRVGHAASPCAVRCYSHLRQTRGTRCLNTDALASDWEQDDTANTAQSPTARLAYSPQELGLHISLKTGVPIVYSSLSPGSAFGELRRQADVNNERQCGKLLVDQAEYAGNMDLWVELLEIRHRIDGFAGVVDIWHGLRKRHIDIPVTGAQADVLWPAFVRAGMDAQDGIGSDMLRHILTYARDLKDRQQGFYARLHKCIVGRWLRSDHAEHAFLWHKKLVRAGLVPDDAVKEVAIDAITPNKAINPARIRTRCFMGMYKMSTERDLYDSCMEQVLKRVEDEVVQVAWHTMFLQHGDYPSADMFARPDVQRLFALDKNHLLPVQHNRAIPVQRLTGSPSLDSAQEAVRFPPMTRALMSTLVGEVHGIKAKEFGDAFVARMFATRAFTLALVIRGLSFFSIEEVGPLALREMAVRCGSPADFCVKLTDLQGRGVKVSTAAFNRIIQKLAAEGQTALYEAMLAGDQHPETYDQLDVQERLLASFLDREQWMQAHITLVGLSLAGVKAQSRAWNILIQHYTRANEWRLLHQIMHNAQVQKVPLNVRTLVYLHRYLLPERRRGKRPVRSQIANRPPFRALDFVTNAYMYSDEMSGNVASRVWVEILKRYGMMHLWSELEKMVLWLATRYSRPLYRTQLRKQAGGSDKMNDARRQAWRLNPSNPLHTIFSQQMQMALVAWGFRNASVKNRLTSHPLRQGLRSAEYTADTGSDPDSPEPWAQGIVLLQKLQELGLPFGTSAARNALKLRLWILFGPGQSTRALNKEMRRRNKLTLTHYVRHANELGLNIRIDPALMGGNRVDAGQKLVIAVFGKYRRSCWQKTPSPEFRYKRRVPPMRPSDVVISHATWLPIESHPP